MKCNLCKNNTQIHRFGGYQHYTSTQEAMNRNVSKGLFIKYPRNQYEIVYECKKCHTCWILAEPDYPVAGYLLCEENI